MMTFVTVATMRRLLLTALVSLTALLVVSATAPPDASASAFYSPVASSYQGWARTNQHAGACSRSMPPQCWHAVWTWSGSTWRQSTVRDYTSVYAYPYAGGWHWIWTQPDGWMAIPTSKLERADNWCSGLRCAA